MTEQLFLPVPVPSCDCHLVILWHGQPPHLKSQRLVLHLVQFLSGLMRVSGCAVDVLN